MALRHGTPKLYVPRATSRLPLHPAHFAMSSAATAEHSLDQELLTFFAQTSATRSECDALAHELVGGNAVPVPVQGVCSYTVYAGSEEESVVQFRLKSLDLRQETGRLARETFGNLAPDVSFKGQIGVENNGKEPLLVYVMSRVKGVSQLDFILARDEDENSAEWFGWRRNLMADVARFV